MWTNKERGLVMKEWVVSRIKSLSVEQWLGIVGFVLMAIFCLGVRYVASEVVCPELGGWLLWLLTGLTFGWLVSSLAYKIVLVAGLNRSGFAVLGWMACAFLVGLLIGVVFLVDSSGILGGGVSSTLDAIWALGLWGFILIDFLMPCSCQGFFAASG
jgi:hypothetical protein